MFLVVCRIVWACACFEQATSLAKSIHTGQQGLGKSVDSPPPLLSSNYTLCMGMAKIVELRSNFV